MQQLKEIIIDRIRKEGPISFRDFMDIALYYPELGYYVADKKSGPAYDYVTAPLLTKLFAEAISWQLTEMWERLGRRKFTIVEYGARDGALCRGILQAISNNPQFYEQVDYVAIDKNIVDREKHYDCFPDKVQTFQDAKQLSPICGCIISNELLDNFPVHVVSMQQELMEMRIGYDECFREMMVPANAQLKYYFEEQEIQLPRGHRSEANLDAIKWLEEISDILQEGFVMTFDYGYTAPELSSARKMNGSLLCYLKHQISEDFFANIGEQDITAHVNFSALKMWGERCGLNCAGFTTQSHFLRSMGAMDALRKMEKQACSADIVRQLTLLFSLGEKIKLMIQEKSCRRSTLSGLQFRLWI